MSRKKLILLGDESALDCITAHRGIAQTSNDSTTDTVRTQRMKTFAAAAMQRLTPRQKQCFLRHYVEGKSVSEIAKEDGVHISAVYRTIERASRRILMMKDLSEALSGAPLTMERIRRIVSSLPPSTKEIVADYIAGLRLSEIADRYQVSAGVIRGCIDTGIKLFERDGVTKSDLRCIRKRSKQERKMNESF